MAIFNYSNYEDPTWQEDNPHSSNCLYCNSKLARVEISDKWQNDYTQIETIHKRTVREYDEHIELEDWQSELDYSRQSTEVWINFCETCGWWRLVKDFSISAKDWQIWQIFFGVTGSLKNLNLQDIKTPIDEARNYLIAKYKSRLSIHPKLFEDVTGNVFRNLGYHSIVTGYTNDGGIDIILEKDNKQIGVQVKRYKNKIEVEQIRSFAGALILAGHLEGIFVSTSDFRSGAFDAAKNYTRKGLPIKLMNVSEFYSALQISQKKFFNFSELAEEVEKQKIDQLYYYGWETPMNSL